MSLQSIMTFRDKILTFPAQPRRRKSHSHLPPVAAEVLLSRQLLSNIAITANPGNVLVKGDNGNHAMQVLVNGSNIEFAALPGTQLTYNGSTAAIQNIPLASLGQSFALTMIMGSGQDQIQIDAGAKLPFSALNLNLGEGANQLGLTHLEMTGNVSISAGNAGNSLALFDSEIGSLNITTGSGADTIRLQDFGMGGTLSIAADAGGGSGNDLIALNASICVGPATILTGGGHDVVDFGPLDFFYNSVSVISSNAAGPGLSLNFGADATGGVDIDNLFVMGGGGNDQVGFQATAHGVILIRGQTQINLGNGANSVVFLNSSGGRSEGRQNFTYVGGQGSDEITANIGTYLQSVNLYLGNGSNHVALDQIGIGANLIVVGGMQQDNIDLYGTSISGQCLIWTCNAGDSVSIRDSYVAGFASIDCGAGTGDKLSIENTHFNQSTNLVLAGSQADLEIQNASKNATFDTVFGGPVLICMSGKNGVINIGYAAPVAERALFKSNVLFLGGGTSTVANVYQQATTYSTSKWTVAGPSLHLLP